MTRPFTAIVAHELRRHVGRWHFIVALGVLIALVNVVWIAPGSGATLLRIGGASAVYDSNTLALVYGSELPLWIGLLGFIVVRGQVRQDWLNGFGSIVAALPVANGSLLAARWLASVIAVAVLSLGALVAVVLMHLARVPAPLELLVYLRAWFWLGAPAILFAAGMAVCCDACTSLIGRLGDVVFFGLWLGCAFALEPVRRRGIAPSNPLLLLDFAGHYSTFARLGELFGWNGMSIGGRASFDAQLPAVVVAAAVWSPAFMLQRGLCALLALAPLALAARLFHRYSPDQLGGGRAASRPARWLAQLNAPLELVNHLLSPLQALARPLLALAARRRGLVGQVLAEVALTLACQPATWVLLPLGWMLGLTAWFDDGGSALLVALVLWGVAIGTISTREHEDGWSPLSVAAPGGAGRRYVRQLLAAVLFGVAINGSFLAARLLHDPVSALALMAVLVAVAAIATLLGHLARVPRPFLFALLLGAFLLDRLGELPALDWLGIHRPVPPAMLALEVCVASALAMTGFLIERRQRS